MKIQKVFSFRIFGKVLFYLSMLYFGHQIYNFYKEVKISNEISSVFKQINATNNYPTGDKKIIIDSVRNDIVKQVQNSYIFNKYGKEYLLDSLRTVTIKFIEPTGDFIVRDNTIAIFIKLDGFEKHFEDNFLSYFFNIQSSKKNVILINSDHMDDDDLAEVITHEIYHYVDMLLGDKDYLSTNLELSKFVDEKIINDKHYLTYKAFIILNGGNNIIKINKENTRLKSLIKDISTMTVDNIEYLSSNEEIFARWKTFKCKLVNLGYIDKMETNLTTSIMSDYSDNSVSLMDLDLLLILDWSKIVEMDNLIK